MTIAESAAGDEFPFSWGLVVATVVVIAIGVFILVFWREFWSGRRIVPAGRLYGERGELVGRSIYPYVGVPALAFGLCLLVGVVIGATTGAVEGTAAPIALVVTVVLVLVTWALLLTIVLFNRPRRLVPPHARDFDGPGR